MSGGEEDEGGGEEETLTYEPVIKLGEGYDAKINFKNIDANKLNALLNDGTVAKGFSLGTSVFSWPPLQKTVNPTQDIDDADIVVLGAEDSPKIAVVKIKTTTSAPVGGHAQYRSYQTNVHWEVWLAGDGDFKIFGDDVTQEMSVNIAP